MTPTVSVRMIVNAVGLAFGFPAHKILHERRSRDHVETRDAVCWLADDLTPYSFPQIARHLGDRDHTTIMAGVKRAAARMAEDEAFARRVGAARDLVLSSLATAEHWQDADAVAAAARVMSVNPWRVATDLSVDEIVAISARAVALEDVAATTYQLLAHLDEYERLRRQPRSNEPDVQLRTLDLVRSCQVMGDALADALQGLGYEYSTPEEEIDERTAAE